MSVLGWFAGDSAPRAVLSSGPRCAALWAGMDQKYCYVGVAWWICACCVQQQVFLGLEVQKTAGFPQLQFYYRVVDISFVVQRLIHMVLVTHRDSPVVRG